MSMSIFALLAHDSELTTAEIDQEKTFELPDGSFITVGVWTFPLRESVLPDKFHQ